MIQALRAVSMVVILAAPLFAGELLKSTEDISQDLSRQDVDFATQGEYIGELNRPSGKTKVGFQIIARGNGIFDGVLLTGGLPGDGWEKGKREEGKLGMTKAGVTTINGPEWKATIKDKVVTISSKDGKDMGTLTKVNRESPLAGAKPPEGALVLFDGTGVSQFKAGAAMTEDKLLKQGVFSVKEFQDCTLHLEFRLPFLPKLLGQQRGNSGCYLQGRYEVQILDSFGLLGKNNECGGLYTIKDPDVNMCFPPLSWQTYDIEYKTAKFAEGKKIKNASVSVKHNGVVIHENVELPKLTTAAPMAEGSTPGPLHLQDHGNQVRFRNIWIVENKPEPAK